MNQLHEIYLLSHEPVFNHKNHSKKLFLFRSSPINELIIFMFYSVISKPV
jgi:hypothetical protein